MSNVDRLVEFGNNALTKGHVATAAKFYTKALALEPTNAKIKENLSGTLVHLDKAQAGYDLLDGLTSPTALSNRGLALARLNRYPESITVLRDALAQNQDATTAVNLALSLLAVGDYDEGFAMFEARLLHDPTVPPWDCRWDGTATDTLVVMHEQGFGDTLMMARYFQPLLDRVARCYLAVPHALNQLLMASFPQHVVISDPRELPADYRWCYVMSLPHLFGTTPATIPVNIPYFKATQTVCDSVKRVGYCYSGGKRDHEALAAINAVRSIPRDQFRQLMTSDYDWVSLQHGDPVLFKDFAETAALIETLDLVITVDTSVFHLAAALGKPTWLLDRYNSCWRHRTASWYPHVKRFTQPTFDDWDTPLEQIRQELDRIN